MSLPARRTRSIWSSIGLLIAGTAIIVLSIRAGWLLSSLFGALLAVIGASSLLILRSQQRAAEEGRESPGRLTERQFVGIAIGVVSTPPVIWLGWCLATAFTWSGLLRLAYSEALAISMLGSVSAGIDDSDWD